MYSSLIPYGPTPPPQKSHWNTMNAFQPVDWLGKLPHTLQNSAESVGPVHSPQPTLGRIHET